jgi:predicted nucleic acid-binding protein
MRTLFDTSVLVAAFIEGHPKHERALPWLSKAKAQEFEFVVSSHTLAELYAVLTTLPVKPRISPNVSWRLLQENIEGVAKTVSLSSIEYKATIKKASESGLSGGIIYDALIAKVAEKSKAERILTFNLKHFRRVWEGKKEALVEP